MKYTNNEAYFDVIEEVDAIVDKSGKSFFCHINWLLVLMALLILYHLFGVGSTVFAEIQGVIEACVRLSGMPDLTLSFMVCI